MKKWKINRPDEETVRRLAAECGLLPLTAAALVSKGYSSSRSVAENFTAENLADPFILKDMGKAVDVINNAVDNGERICIYGDYDCDGIMSTFILYSYLRECGADVTYYIPERTEGYGLNMNAVEKISSDGVSLIITVDNGISAISEAERAYELGMRLVITDHHQVGEKLPKAEAIVNPHRPDCPSTFKGLCGAGVALKLVAALDFGDYTTALNQFGEFAAIATVADIVDLTGENRFIVSHGIEMINNSDSPAIIALKQVSGCADSGVNTKSIGFGLGPRINATGRISSPKKAMELLLCENYEDALTKAKELNAINEERKKMERDILSEIYRTIDENPEIARKRVIFVCGREWHHGVIGIVAAKIVERFGKPCFIASESNGEIRGSARSFGEFSVFNALTYAADSLEKFGGHVGAGGFSIKNGMADEFDRLINEYARLNFPEMPVYEVVADVPVKSAELTIENVRNVDILEPFGTGNEKPLFYLEKCYVSNVALISEGKYARLTVKVGNATLEALSFRIPPARLVVKSGDYCDIIANIAVDEFRGETRVKAYIEDIRLHGFQEDKFFNALNAFEKFMRGEALPKNYYRAMLPDREQIAHIYKCIPDGGIITDKLFSRLGNDKINYCRFCVAVEAMKQLGLVSLVTENSSIKRVPNAPKTDINSAPVLVSLREKTKE